MHRNIRIKVCGMREPANIRALVNLKPDYIGFIFYPASKRFVQQLDNELVKSIPPSIKKTGVFVNASINEILEYVVLYKLDAVQLHGEESVELCNKLREKGLEIIKAFGVDESFNFDQLTPYQDTVDYFMFDTRTPQHGGSGLTFNWNILEKYQLDKPYFLSGGIGPDNLEQIRLIRSPWFYAVDLNSRFETEPGLKDINKLNTVFDQIRSLFGGNWRINELSS